MRGRRVSLAMMLAGVGQIGGVALAADAPAAAKQARPLVGPPPDWVVPTPVPAEPPNANDAATVTLLADSQKKLTKNGDFGYYETAYKIESPKGLDQAALQIDWDPALETITLHHYRIRRDGKVLDLLGDGSKLSVIQREKNMEDSALDGELTVSMQPDDVRVGDIVEIAFTRARRDPAMGGRSETLIGSEDGTPYGRLHIRILWPDDKKMQWRAFPGVLQPKLTHTAAGNELVADVSNVTTPRPPRAAPARFMTINAIDVSEFGDWAEVSRAMMPFYAAATKLGDQSPVRAEARRIAAETSDPGRRAELALELVQNQIRYLFLGMDDGGYIPAAADLTWSRRFGDCKGKAVLLVALLRELGIQADPVLVSTDAGDLAAHRLPAMGAFDHVIVRAQIAGRTYWMDGTRLGDTRLDLLRTPPYHVGLPIAAATKGLLPLTPEPFTQPSETVSIALDASAGIDAAAAAKGEMRFRGTDGIDMRMKYAGLSPSDRDQQLRELWRKNYDFVAPASITTAVDDSTGDFVISMTGTAKMDWYSDVGTRWYELDRARVGWKFDTDRSGTIEQDVPFEIDYPDYWESRETIKLPAGGAGFKLQGGSVDQTAADIYAFHRKVGIADGAVTMESSTRALGPELPASKAEQARSEMGALANTGVFVRVPDDYMATAGDIAALQDNKAALAVALRHRGAVHFDRNELADSIADENAAIAIDPKDAAAQSIRALAMAIQRDPKADAAADGALALDDKQQLAWRAKGVVAFVQKRYADADADYSKQIALAPDDGEALAERASVRTIEAKFEDALADSDKALAISPSPALRLIRATALAGLGRKEESLAEADRALAEHPDNQAVRKGRAMLRVNFGERDLALDDFSALIKQSPSVEYYLSRAQLWPATEKAKRDSDIAAALAIDPVSVKALALRASTAIDAGNFEAAQADIATLDKRDGDILAVHQLRLQLLEKQRKGPEALELANAYLAKHPDDATALNERCWEKATFNLQLQTAVADCDASLKLVPNNPATLDSRAFAKLRLGATDDAIADYDAALKLAPALPASLYGRAIARARKGDEAGARTDLAEARKLSPEIDTRFAGFGISLPASLATAPEVDRAHTN